MVEVTFFDRRSIADYRPSIFLVVSILTARRGSAREGLPQYSGARHEHGSIAV